MFGLIAPGPVDSETSSSGLLRQSHIERSSAGHLEGSFDPPGAVAVLTAPSFGPPPPHATAIATAEDAAMTSRVRRETFIALPLLVSGDRRPLPVPVSA